MRKEVLPGPVNPCNCVDTLWCIQRGLCKRAALSAGDQGVAPPESGRPNSSEDWRVAAARRALDECYFNGSREITGDDFEAIGDALAFLTETQASLVQACERACRWINTSVPIGTEAATTMLGILRAALSQSQDEQP